MEAFMKRLLIVIVVLAPLPAYAQDAAGRAFSLQDFRPAVDAQGMVTVNASQTLPHLDYSLALVGSYAYRSLSLENDGVALHVEHLVTMQLQAALGLFGGPKWRQRMHGIGLQLGVSLPVDVMYGDRTPSYRAADPNDNRTLSFSGQGIGDIGLNAKVRFLEDAGRRPGLALLLTVAFPTGNSEHFLGEGQTTLRPEIIIDKTFGRTRRARIAFNVGVLVRPSTHTFTDRGTTFGPMSAPVCAPLSSMGVCGTQLSRSLASEASYSIGASYTVVPHRFDLIGEVFGAYDVARSKGGAPVEILAAAKVYLASSSFFEIGASASLLPPNIVDGHGNMTGAPLARGFVGFVFEPKSGDRGRGGWQEEEEPPPPPPPPPPPERAPEPEPEPEPPPTRVIRTSGVLKTFEKVYFKTASAEILPRSFPLLDDVVTLLQGNADISLLEIAGHADERGDDDYNLRLTRARAESVRKYLVDHGIDPSRLISNGYGEQQPAIDERTLRPCTQHNDYCWDKNRRVEFRILAQ